METAQIDRLFPEMDASSAVFPTGRVVGDTLHLAYHLPRCHDSAVVTFVGVSHWRYGGPNDEGLASHPLWGCGLTYYNFHEVRQTDGDSALRRWVATFHDGTFEISAHEPSVKSKNVAGCSPSKALDAVLGPGQNQVLDELASR